MSIFICDELQLFVHLIQKFFRCIYFSKLISYLKVSKDVCTLMHIFSVNKNIMSTI